MLTNPVTRKATGHQFLRNYCQLAVLLLQLGVRMDGHADPAAPALSFAESARCFWWWSRFAVCEFRLPEIIVAESNAMTLKHKHPIENTLIFSPSKKCLFWGRFVLQPGLQKHIHWSLGWDCSLCKSPPARIGAVTAMEQKSWVWKKLSDAGSLLNWIIFILFSTLGRVSDRSLGREDFWDQQKSGLEDAEEHCDNRNIWQHGVLSLWQTTLQLVKAAPFSTEMGPSCAFLNSG